MIAHSAVQYVGVESMLHMTCVGSSKESISLSPAGLPAGCQVMSINKGFPVRILSSLDIRLTAPALVRGGKNSREKNLSLDSIRALIFSPSVASYVLNMRGEAGRELSGVVDTE